VEFSILLNCFHYYVFIIKFYIWFFWGYRSRSMNPDNEVFLLNNPVQPRIFGLTSKLGLYYHNPITGQLVTLRLKRRHPHPIKNTFILLNKYKSRLEKKYTSTERITNPERNHRMKEYYKLVIRLLKKNLRSIKNCIA